jgi:hypothetical protein
MPHARAADALTSEKMYHMRVGMSDGLDRTLPKGE